MKQKLKMIKGLVLISIVLCSIMVWQAAAQENDGQGTTENAPMFVQIVPGDTPEPQQGNAQQLNQLDRDIERLRQITQEAEQIRNRIARQAGAIQSRRQNITQPPSDTATTPQRQLRGQARGQIPSATAILPQGQRQNPPLLSRQGVQTVINNLPQMVDQLRNTLNNNLDRVQNTYQRIQKRLINIQVENQKLRDENQKLRNENQKLKKRLQKSEPSNESPKTDQVGVFIQP